MADQGRPEREPEAAVPAGERYRLIFASGRDPQALLLAQPLRFVDVNEAFCQAYGHPRAEALALDPLALAREPAELRALFAAVAAEGRARRPLQWQRRRDGSLFPVEVQGLSLQLEEGPGLHLWLHDLSELRTLQEKLLLADRLASLGALAGGIAHEISGSVGVLTANLGFAVERLRALEHPLRSELAELREVGAALSESGEAAERLRTLAFDLKTFARPPGGPKKPVELRPLLESVLNLLSTELRHRTQLDVQLDGAPAVAGSEGRLGQAFLYLMLHAVTALPPQRASQNQLRLRASGRGDQAVVELELSGAPVPPEERRLIFDPFFAQGHSRRSPLPLCSALVEQLGGTIALTEGSGGRSLLRITLPAAAAKRPASEPRLLSPEALPRVLVVDDEELLCETVRRMLLGEAEAVVLTDGDEALRRLLARERFDVVLCNVALQRRSGPELFAAVRDGRPELLPRLGFLNDGELDLAAQRFVRTHWERVLEKPFGRDDLRRLVKTLLEGLPVAEG
jgi:PAS domain S-box-containing protein